MDIKLLRCFIEAPWNKTREIYKCFIDDADIDEIKLLLNSINEIIVFLVDNDKETSLKKVKRNKSKLIDLIDKERGLTL